MQELDTPDLISCGNSHKPYKPSTNRSTNRAHCVGKSTNRTNRTPRGFLKLPPLNGLYGLWIFPHDAHGLWNGLWTVCTVCGNSHTNCTNGAIRRIRSLKWMYGSCTVCGNSHTNCTNGAICRIRSLNWMYGSRNFPQELRKRPNLSKKASTCGRCVGAWSSTGQSTRSAFPADAKHPYWTERS